MNRLRYCPNAEDCPAAAHMVAPCEHREEHYENMDCRTKCTRKDGIRNSRCCILTKGRAPTGGEHGK